MFNTSQKFYTKKPSSRSTLVRTALYTSSGFGIFWEQIIYIQLNKRTNFLYLEGLLPYIVLFWRYIWLFALHFGPSCIQLKQMSWYELTESVTSNEVSISLLLANGKQSSNYVVFHSAFFNGGCLKLSLPFVLTLTIHTRKIITLAIQLLLRNNLFCYELWILRKPFHSCGTPNAAKRRRKQY